MPANGNARSEPGNTVHVVNGLATAISTDDTVALLKFEDIDGDEFALTLPVQAIAVLRAMVNDLEVQARALRLGPGHTPLRYPATLSVGCTDAVRGVVLLMVDPDTNKEEVIVIPDKLGLEIAKALEQNIVGRMTPADRAKHLASIPPKSQLIIPGR